MNTFKLSKLISIRESLSLNNKKKLLEILKNSKILLIKEEVISKKFDTKAEFNTYIAQHRGLEILPQEKQAILNYTEVKPSELNRFFIKYETTDNFSNNNTTIVKKLKDGNQFCWTAFSKNENPEAKSNPPEPPTDNNTSQQQIQIPTQSTQSSSGKDQLEESNDQSSNNTIEIIKSIPFTTEIDGSKVLSDFLIKLDI